MTLFSQHSSLDKTFIELYTNGETELIFHAKDVFII